MVPQQRVQTNPRRKTPWSARLQSSDSLRMKISKSSVQTQEKDEGGDLVIHGLQGSETQQEPPSETQQQSLSFQTLPNVNVDASHQTTVPPALLTVSQTILPAGSTVSSAVSTVSSGFSQAVPQNVSPAVSTVSSAVSQALPPIVSQAVPQNVPPAVSTVSSAVSQALPPIVSPNVPRSGSSHASVVSPVEYEIYWKMVQTLEKMKLQGRDKENVFKGRAKLVEVLAWSYPDVNQLRLMRLIDLAFEKVFPYNSAGSADTWNQPKQPNTRMPCLQGPYKPADPIDTRNHLKQPNTRMPCLQGQGVRPTGGAQGQGVRPTGGPQGQKVRPTGGPQAQGVRPTGVLQGQGVRPTDGLQGKGVRPSVTPGASPHLQALYRVVAPNQHQRNVQQIRQPQQTQQFMRLMTPMPRPQYDTQSSHPMPHLYPVERHNSQMPQDHQLYPHRLNQQAAENADRQSVIECSNSERRSAIDKIGNTSRATRASSEYLVSKPREIETELGSTTQYHQQMEIQRMQRMQQMQNVSQLSQHYTGAYNQEYHAVSFVVYYVKYICSPK